MRSRRRATSRKKRRATTGAIRLSIGRETRRGGRAAWLGDAFARNVFTTRWPGNIIFFSWTRASRTGRSRRWKSSTCARISTATHRAEPVSESLRAAIAARLEEKTQSLVLINRRGYSWFVICRGCGAGVQCENCSISLTYHKQRQRLECHYCGYSIRAPESARNAIPNTCISSATGAEQRRGIPAREISSRAHRAAGPRHGAHQARIPAGAGRVREGQNRHSRGNADGRERTRFPARHARGRSRRRSRARAPRFRRRRDARFSC